MKDGSQVSLGNCGDVMCGPGTSWSERPLCRLCAVALGTQGLGSVCLLKQMSLVYFGGG